ncbi:hypothetical protein JMJ76_0015286 [Colletotrichum scovillei]|nr:hypothetical protein JMJ76_0015286 [Colletotrichum scovillei]
MAQPDLGHSVSSRPNKEHLNPSPMFQDHPSDTLSGSRQCSEVKMRIQDSSTSNAPPLALGRSGKAPNAPVRLGDGAARPHSILLLGAARPCSSAIALACTSMHRRRDAIMLMPERTDGTAPMHIPSAHQRHGISSPIWISDGRLCPWCGEGGHPIPWLAQPKVQMANSTSISIPHFEIDEV